MTLTNSGKANQFFEENLAKLGKNCKCAIASGE